MISPKIEPEIVFNMKSPLAPGVTDAAAALEAVEWLALGFEIIDCPYADWTFQPADFVAAYGLHAALVIGDPQPVTSTNIAELATAMSRARATQNGVEPLAAGDLVSSGTLTESTPIQPGPTWTASVEGIDLPTLTLSLV
jgi:2-keto-4-pentenoate hydratase